MGVSVWGLVFHGTETLARGKVPVLDLPLGVYCSKNISSFEVGVFRAPGDVREGDLLVVLVL